MDTTSFIDFVRGQLATKGKTVAQLCRDTGLSRQNFFHWRKGRVPTSESIRLISDYLGIPPESLMDILENGLVRKYCPADDPTPPPGYATILEYELRLSAGTKDNEPEWVEVHSSKPVIYDEDFFIEHMVKPQQCKRARVYGDSMEPFIYDGDRVTFASFPDPHVPFVHIVDGEIYVISIKGAMKVKRLSTCKNGLVITSDNPAYPPETYLEEELDDIRIYGRVLEIKRSL